MRCKPTRAFSCAQPDEALDRLGRPARPAGATGHPCSFTHGGETLRALPTLCAINSALQVDLAGCVNAERIGARRISLPGGLPDFARAASAASRGCSIIALRAATSSAADSEVQSNIVHRLPAGQPPTLLPEAVDFVVTEHGIAALRGASASQRRRALLAIAHPAWGAPHNLEDQEIA